MNISRGQSLSGKRFPIIDKKTLFQNGIFCHFKFCNNRKNNFCFRSRERFSFCCQNKSVFCFDVFLLAKQAHKNFCLLFLLLFQVCSCSSHSAHSHKLLLFHLESFLNSTKNTISGSKIKRNPRFLYKCFFLSKNACSLRTSEYLDKPSHFALTILRPGKSKREAKKQMSLCKPLFDMWLISSYLIFQSKETRFKVFLKAFKAFFFKAKKRQTGIYFTEKGPRSKQLYDLPLIHLI